MKKNCKRKIQVRNARKNPYVEERPNLSQPRINKYSNAKPMPNWEKEETDINDSKKNLILCGNIVSTEDDAQESIAFYIKSCNSFLQLFENENTGKFYKPEIEYAKFKNAMKHSMGNTDRNDMLYRETKLSDWIKMYNTEEADANGYVYLNMDNDNNNPYSAKIYGEQYMKSLDTVLSKEKYPICAIELEFCYEEDYVAYLYGEAYILNLDVNEYMLIAFSLNTFNENDDEATYIYFPSILAESDGMPNEEDVNLEDCGSLNLISMNIPNMEILDRLDGKNILLNTGEIHMIDSEKDLWLIGESVKLRSAITCLNSHTICNVCKGKAKDEVE